MEIPFGMDMRLFRERQWDTVEVFCGSFLCAIFIFYVINVYFTIKPFSGKEQEKKDRV